jgi:predicted transcriptional regulator/predicted XRE-type DNA-binding protein
MKMPRKIVTAVQFVDSDAGRVIGESLKKLRELTGLTQAQIADRLKVGQAAVSKIERRGDVQISSLKKYVEAIGAKLKIDAVIQPAAIGDYFKSAFDLDGADDNQLVFPIFGDDLFRAQRDVVLSVRPQYSEQIIRGKKTVELRRRFPLSAPRGTIAYIYCTAPVRAMVGSAEITGVKKLPVSEIWKKYGANASIEKKEFNLYFEGLKEGFALKFTNARPLRRQLELSELRERFGFEPPQSFLYATPVLRKALRDEYTDVSD